MVEMDAIIQLQGGVSEMEGRRRTRGRRLLTVRTYLLYSEGNSSLSRYGMAWHGGRRSGVAALFEDRCPWPFDSGTSSH
jgi:hypothetical protein